MSFRTPIETEEEHIAYIYELLRRLDRPSLTTLVGDIVSTMTPPPGDTCPCILNIRTCPEVAS